MKLKLKNVSFHPSIHPLDPSMMGSIYLSISSIILHPKKFFTHVAFT